MAWGQQDLPPKISSRKLIHRTLVTQTFIVFVQLITDKKEVFDPNS